MLSAKGYFDGQNYILEDDITAKKNQRVIITLLDDYLPQRSVKSLEEIKSYMIASTKSVPDGISTADYIKRLRED